VTNGNEDDEPEPIGDEEEELRRLERELAILEGRGAGGASLIYSSPLSDEEYVALAARPYEVSLDWVVRSVVTADRASMNAIDQFLQRSMAHFRRWVPVQVYYRVHRAWEFKSEPGKVKADRRGKPIPLRDKGTKEVLRDREGNLRYEQEDPKEGYAKVYKEAWLSPTDLEKLGTRRLNRLMRSGRVVKRRGWFLCPNHNERAIISPRESFLKVPKNRLNEELEALMLLQRNSPNTVVEDIYWNRRPEKWAPRDQWDGDFRLILGQLNLYELCKLAEYRVGRRYFSAQTRWEEWLRVREQVIREHATEHPDAPEIPDRVLQNRTEEAYNWWLPYTQHEYVRRMLPDSMRFDKSPDSNNPNADINRSLGASERATAFFETVNLVSHIISYPTITGPDSVDWSTCQIYFPINEEIRDFARMTGHYQQCRSNKWKYDRFELSDSDVGNSLNNDWGGARSRIDWGDDWAFRTIWNTYEERRPPTRFELYGEDPITAAQQADLDQLQALWQVELRERNALLGPAQEMTPTDECAAAQTHYGLFGKQRLDVTNGGKELRKAFVVAREGGAVKLDLRAYRDTLSAMRHYERGEIQALELSVAFWFDPWDTTRHNRGLRSDAIRAELASRAAAYCRLQDEEGRNVPNAEPLLKIVDAMDILREWHRTGDPAHLEHYNRVTTVQDRPINPNEVAEVDFFNQVEIYRQLVYKQPARQLANMVERQIDEWRHHNVMHLRKEINELLTGIPVNGSLRAYFEKWYRESDDRVWDFVFWEDEMGSSASGASGAHAFNVTKAAHLISEGFGLGYGTLPEQQSRQERIITVGLYTDYYQEMRRILAWFGVRMSAISMMVDIDDEGVRANRTWVTISEMKMEVASSIKSGKILYPIARDELWPRLQRMAPELLNESFPFQAEQASKLDNDVVNQVLYDYCGNTRIPTEEEAAVDPEAQRRRNELIRHNRRRYNRIVEGRFFVINR